MAYSIEEIKRKQWLKLKRPFNDAACLEVYVKGEWYRVTGNDFISSITFFLFNFLKS